MSEFKIGDVIGHRTMEGISLLEIIDIYNMMSGATCLSTKLLLKPDLTKPSCNTCISIILPHQGLEVRTKEEYLEEVQSEIDKKQNILNELKEKYNV